ncbi:MAG TPA: OmpH family outer membrane protein, partial [Saprospiraceae bacterium]|nr:OmpH family outer membrane protein [Saprospiraceae bacterium]
GLCSVNAQKFGHVNSAMLIEQHPKVSGANTELESFQKMLGDSFSIKVKSFEDKYKKFLEESNNGVLSQVQAEAKQAELRTEQQALATEEQQLQFRVVQKREALLKPILSDIDAAIQSIGKEGNYTMIFDTSVAGALLFAQTGDDLTDMVKTKCMAK